jgi:hypothetical protein
MLRASSEGFSWARSKAVDTARRLLSGETSLLLATRQLRPLLIDLGLDRQEPFVIFIAVDSETDSLPYGPERQHWATDSLAKKDIEIRAAEELYRQKLIKASEELLHLLDSSK